MLRCILPIRTAHRNALSDKKLHLDQKMANSYCFAQGRALGSISRRKPKQLTPRRTSRIAVKNLTPAPENAWVLHLLLLASFLSSESCISKLNVPKFLKKSFSYAFLFFVDMLKRPYSWLSNHTI